jgi:hypothetical protein
MTFLLAKLTENDSLKRSSLRVAATTAALASIAETTTASTAAAVDGP